jgi:hypothetical protein
MMNPDRYAAHSENVQIGEEDDDMHTIRVHNRITSSLGNIRSEFEIYGTVLDVYHKMDKNKKVDPLYLFVRFEHRLDMLRALQELQGKTVDGKYMVLSVPSQEMQTSGKH